MKEKILISAPRFYGIDEAIRDSFDQLGFESVLLNCSTQKSLLEKIAKKISLKFPSIKSLPNAIIKYYLDQENRQFIQFVKDQKPDLLFIVKGEHLFPETLKIIKEQIACPIISYIWDDPFYSYAGNFSDDFRKFNFEKGMQLYDLIFVYDTFYVKEIQKRGVENVEYLPLATDITRYRQIDVNVEDKARFGYDLCFVGSPYPNRVEILDKLKEYNLGVFGEGWINYFANKGLEVPSYYKGKAIGEDVLKIYCSSKMVLNIHDPEAREGLNTRTFDILACGAFELVDDKKNLQIHFQVPEEIVSFNNSADLLKLIERYAQNEPLLKKIASKGQQRVFDEHTWKHRAKIIIEKLNYLKLFKNNIKIEGV